jgi:hypothetical protein
MHDFVPLLMILAFAGVAYRRPSEAGWRRWRTVAWATLAASALLHVQISFTQAVHGHPVDPNMMKTFVGLSPAVRRAWPSPLLEQRERQYRQELEGSCRSAP